MELARNLVSTLRAIRNQGLPELTHSIFTLDAETCAAVQINVVLRRIFHGTKVEVSVPERGHVAAELQGKCKEL